LEDNHKKLLPYHAKNIDKWKSAVDANCQFINAMIDDDLLFHEDVQLQFENKVSSDFDMDKVVSTLRQLTREWSAEGATERKESYGILIDELCRVLPVDSTNAYKYRVLCPGSGLGRLPLEICLRGYACQGNEWSYFMLVTGNFMLNKVNKLNHYTIYPYVHQTSNLFCKEDQFRPVVIPDILPCQLPPNADFSCAAGDFVEIYSNQPEQWDAVVTCFFLDCSNNIIEFIETIKKILKPGGRWINIGPLLYHYSDMNEQSVELGYDEIKHVVLEQGFVYEKDYMQNTTYIYNERSMMNTNFNCCFFSVYKK